ncbi:MAG: hypothetical protein K0U84_01250 [Actinomycetia bacterium]|nr:hypothetical protein [Actinomycetes bacterium]
MLPTRSRLEGWNPDSLSFAGTAIQTAGESVEGAVDRISNNVKIMPETKAWSGPAHDAASAMFDRAHTSATSFSDLATAVAGALHDGATTIGAARKTLLAKADEVDGGPLNVSDAWVVLIDPGSQSAEQIAELTKQVVTEQLAINKLLVAVDDADTSTANKVLAEAKKFGFEPPATGGLAGLMLPGGQRPVDEVPNSREPLGLLQQNVMRGEDMSTTVRETRERYNDEGNFEKTLIMQDGSRQVVTSYERDYDYGVPDMTTIEHWDAEGNWLSKTTTTRGAYDGSSQTVFLYKDFQLVTTVGADGHVTAEYTLFDGRSGQLPPDSPFFAMDAPEIVGGALTGLAAHTTNGGRLPVISMNAIDNIGAGAKFGGPALGILSTLWDMGTAETAYDRCVTGFAGSFGVLGDLVGGAAGGGLGAVMPGAQAVTVPLFAVGGSVLVGKWMEGLGKKVAVAFCE